MKTSSPPALDRESGMTLIEVLIALVVMSIISVAILGTITTLTTSSQNHRGIANVDAATLAYAEAIKHHVNFQTTLVCPPASPCPPATTALSATDPTIYVADASEFNPSTAAPVEVVIDGELIKVTGVDHTANTLSVDARGDLGTTAWTHAPGATVSATYTPCPSASQLTPLTFTASTYPAVTTLTITNVEYWIPTNQDFESQSNCMTFVQSNNTICGPDTSPAPHYLLPECDPGLQRVTLTATGDATTANSVTTTEVLVRRGSG